MPFQKLSGCIVYLPKSYDKTKQYPCIVLLHGIGERGDGSDAALQGLQDFLMGQYNSIAAQLDRADRYILVAPQLPSSQGNWSNPYVDKGMTVAQSLNANPKRMYLAGISLGGGGVWKYLSTPGNSAKFAAAVVICGVGGWSDLCNIKCPVWAFHAANDNIVGVGNTHSAVDGINGCSVKPPVPAKKTIYPEGGHYVWGPALGDKPGINGETVNVIGWFDLNEQGSPVAVPVTGGGTEKPSPPSSGLKAVPIVTNLTSKTATLDGSKSEGNPTRYAWFCNEWPTKGTWNVFKDYNKEGPVKELQNLVPGYYSFSLTVFAGNGSHKEFVSLTIPAVDKSPVFAEADIPAGKTKVIVREDKTVEFA